MVDRYVDADGLVITLTDGVLSLRLDDQRKRNAMNDGSLRAMVDALERAQSDERVRAVLLTGAGADFCSGFDIVARNAGGGKPRTGSIQRRLPAQAHRLIPLLCELQVPVVAGITGYAVGLGMQLALASDFVLADRTATFWEPFVARGMTPDSGATWLAVRAVGPLRARRLLLLGERLDAERARDWGVVHEVVDDAEASAEELAARLAAGPTVALGLTRKLINEAADAGLREQLEREAFALELSSRSPDFREGLRAFVDKRDPAFEGR